ncbi:AraC family transcriptional regulator [Mesorhizobium sp. M1423]|uniref:helix-turn-helix transcriptional regulator n=3 Tax=unclassified Mesorhizobium TaxID=325217 RepID=UPI0033372687
MIYELHYGSFGHVSVLELSDPLTEHAHSMANLSVWLEGDPVELSVASKRGGFDQDRATLIAPFVSHSVSLPQGGRAKTLSFYLDRRWLGTILAGADPTSRFTTVELKLDRTSQALAAGIGRDLAGGNGLQIDARMEALLLGLLGAAKGGRDSADGRPPLDFRLSKAIRLMQADIAREHSLNEIARHAGMSRARFFSMFRDHMDLTPGTYWNTLRIEHAISIMRQQGTNLTRLAGDLGFDAQGNFSRFFRQQTGVAPKQYRRAMRQAISSKKRVTIETHA